MRATRVLYVEDDPALRGIIAHQLQRNPDIDLCAAVSNSGDALERAKTQLLDVALLDLSLGVDSMNGLELGLALRHVISDIGIVIYSQHATADFMTRVPEEAQWGWSVVQKRSDVDLVHLVEVLRRTAQGFSTVDAQMISSRTHGSVSAIEQLTLRQREIMALAASGLDAVSIADELGLSHITIRQELSRVYKVLVPDPKKGTDLRMTAVVRYLRETRLYEQDGRRQ